MSAIKPSIYSTVRITSQDGRDVDFQVACASIDIYEDVMVPSISAKIQIVNTGGTIKSDGVPVSMYDGLKIRGGEKVQIRIEPNSANNEVIDFMTKPLFVRGIRNLLRDASKEFMLMNLVTENVFINETKFVGKAFPEQANISEHVQSILEEYLDLTGDDYDIDPTTNKLGIIGNQMHPFQLITRMASQSVFGGNQQSGGTLGGSAGFFFYQTREGYKFKSIDNLINQAPKATFIQTEKNFSSITYQPTPDLPSLDYKIISYEVISNQDLLDKLMTGAYATERRYFDPLTSQVTTPKDSYTIENNLGSIKNLGAPFDPDTLKLAFSGSKSFTNLPSQIVPSTIDRGTTAKGVSKELTRDPTEYLNQAKMRYNSLFLQVMRIQVPLNSTLHAGDVVRCKFPRIQDGDNIQFEKEQISGLYMIKELCHHFDPQGSYTAMLLVRDTIGKRQ